VSVETVPLQRAANAIAGGSVVAFTGAGISAESGIPTFRDPGGLWDRFDPAEFGTWDGLMELAMRKPDALAEFLVEFRRVLGTARPGPAHRALARLEDAGFLDSVITQNVDGLHQDAGSRRVVELHGSFRGQVCLVCGHRETLTREEVLDGLDRAIAGLRAAFVASLASLLPRCSRCHGPARSDFVAFGEAVRDFPEAERMAKECRTMLVVGSSGEVFPAADLPVQASAAGALVVEVAGGPSEIRSDIRLPGKAGDILPRLIDLAAAKRGGEPRLE
jgi:NAD-dependent deacetylase